MSRSRTDVRQVNEHVVGVSSLNALGKNLLLLAATVCLALLLCETAFRLWHHVSPFDRSNFSLRVRDRLATHRILRPDDLLGWAVKDGLDTPRIHSVDHGVRRNGSAQTGTRRGSILAVGPSLTFGGLVADEESWPAQLERMSGQAVDNAAVGGYGIDQVVLRAEQMLPVTQPRILLVGISNTQIGWTFEHTGMGGAAPKPFFTVEHGSLVEHAVDKSTRLLEAHGIAVVMGYSLMFDSARKAVWRSQVRADNAAVVDLSCRLLARLKAVTDRQGVRAIVVSEGTGNEVLGREPKPESLARVEDCAQQVGYERVDVYGALAAREAAAPGSGKLLFVESRSGSRGHLSALGNQHVAEILAARLGGGPASTRATW